MAQKEKIKPMKETELETFKRVSGEASSFEIAKLYHLERKRIEAECFTCTSSGETFEIGDKAYLIYNDELDEHRSCPVTIGLTSLTNRKSAYFSSHEKGIEWNHAKFKTKE